MYSTYLHKEVNIMANSDNPVVREDRLSLWLDQYGLEWRYERSGNVYWIQVRKKGSWFGFGWKIVGRATYVLDAPGNEIHEARLRGILRANGLL